jgi:ABC-type antimicrobial peptide transport system permease subunit
VTSFALAEQPPYQPLGGGQFHLKVDDPRASSPVEKDMEEQTVGAGYFAVLNEPILAGREFEDRDQRVDAEALKASRAPVPTLPLVLNEKAARALFGKDNPIGKHLRGDRRGYEVVGVVPDRKDAGGSILVVAYLPLTWHDFAHPPGGGITIIARGHSAEDALGGVRSVVASMDQNLTLFNVQTLSEYLEVIRSAIRTALRTLGGIGVFGLVLSAIGLAGVTGCAVAQRRKEIGIRMALGARKSQVLALVLRESATLIAVGTVIGFLGGVAVAKALSAFTSDFSDAVAVGVDDPRLLIGAPLLLAVLALLACYIPARRAAKIDPIQALRQE